MVGVNLFKEQYDYVPFQDWAITTNLQLEVLEDEMELHKEIDARMDVAN